MSNLETRDYAGMEEVADGDWVLKVSNHSGDERLLAIEAKLDAILAKLNIGIKVQTVPLL